MESSFGYFRLDFEPSGLLSQLRQSSQTDTEELHQPVYMYPICPVHNESTMFSSYTNAGRETLLPCVEIYI